MPDSQCPKGAAGDFKKYTPNFSGGGDNYCYVYDPVIARAYTKKYPIASFGNTPVPSTTDNHSVRRDFATRKYSPASENFTPSPHGVRADFSEEFSFSKQPEIPESSPGPYTMPSYLQAKNVFQGEKIFF